MKNNCQRRFGLLPTLVLMLAVTLLLQFTFIPKVSAAEEGMPSAETLEASVTETLEPDMVHTNKQVSAYNCTYTKQWSPMFPHGFPTNDTWPAWDDTHYAEVVEDGCNDIGALHMVSRPYKNTAVAIDAGMIPGEVYTLGLWAKGISDSGRVLALYAIGNPVVIGLNSDLTVDWSYYEIQFTASHRQLNLLCVDWGNTDIYIDNITLKNADGTDLLEGQGDFYRVRSQVIEEANLNFESAEDSKPTGWTVSSVKAQSAVQVYTDNVYSGERAVRIHRQKGEIDYTFLYSQHPIPVTAGDQIEVVAHIASRNSNSGHFSMYFLGLGEGGDGDYVDFMYGQERVTNAGFDWSQWDTYEMVYTIPEGVSYIQLALRVGGSDADVLVDDIQFYNYTENNNCIYLEDFAAPAATTGLPGGWEWNQGSATVTAGSGLQIEGDEKATAQVSTRLFNLKTNGLYNIQMQLTCAGTAVGEMKLEAVNWKGEVTAQAVFELAENGNLSVDFEAQSAVYYRLSISKIGGNGSLLLQNLSIYHKPKPGRLPDKIAITRFQMASNVTAGSIQSVSAVVQLEDSLPVMDSLPIYFVREDTKICGGELKLIEGQTTDQWTVGGQISVNFTLQIPQYLPAGSYTVQLADDFVVTGGVFADNCLTSITVTQSERTLTTTSSVEMRNGKANLIVNGQIEAPMWYARPENPILYEAHTVKKFAEAGVDTVVSYVFLNNNYGDVWTPEGFTPNAVDAMLLSTLEGNPDAKLIIAIDLNAPQWWLDANPGELAALANSKPERTNVSFASEKWKQEAGQIMLQAIDYMMAQPYANNIIGFKITGGYTLEWNWWATSGVYDDVGDFSECGITAFRAWLTEKYGTDQALQLAYGDKTVTLATAMPPSAALRSDDYLDTVITVQDHPQMMDYEMYMADLKADTIEYFCKLVKKHIENRLIVGTYAGYFFAGGGYEFSSAVANHYYQRILQSENIDFVKTPWMYGMREIGESAQFMGPVDSLDLYGKLWIVEDDTRLNLQRMDGNQDDNAAVGWTRNYQQSVEQIKRNFSYILGKGMGVSFYNLMWNFYDDDQYYSVISCMKEEMLESLYVANEETAQIAVFVDGESQMLIPYEEEHLNSVLYVSVFREQLKELGYIGAPYDIYLLDDLAAGLVPEHKVNIFLATNLMTEQERAAVEGLKKNGNILLFQFTDAISDGKRTDLSLMESLVGMNLQIISTERQPIAAAKISNTNHWLTDGMYVGQSYGVRHYNKLSPVIGVSDAEAVSLADHTTSSGLAAGQTALAVKDNGDWICIYSALPNMPQCMLRNIVEKAEIHTYTDSGSDVIYAGNGYVSIHSLFAGERTLSLPEHYAVYDVFNGEWVSNDTDSFTVTLSGKETNLYRLIKQCVRYSLLDLSTVTSAYTAKPGVWIPMHPEGTPDNGTWAAWDSTHYGEIVAGGYKDAGALHLISAPHKNTGVAIDAGMTPGEKYTLGLWAKGTSNSGRVLALYANGDPAIITTSDKLTKDWSYYEIQFTAGISQLNMLSVDWGNTDIYIDNITLRDVNGQDLLSGFGDFSRLEKDGHDLTEWTEIKAPTFTQNGQLARICSVCGQTVETQEIPMVEAAVDTWGITLDDNLLVTFYLKVGQYAYDQNAQVHITMGDYSAVYGLNDISGVVTVRVPAAYMTEDIVIQIVMAEESSNQMIFTVREYADRLLGDNAYSEYHPIIKEMLCYGGAAQRYFGINTEKPADANITSLATAVPESVEDGPMVVGDVPGIRFYGASLLYRDRTAVRLYFTVTGNIEDYQAEGYKFVEKDGMYYVEITDILPQHLSERITLTVRNQNGNAMTVTYSPMQYIVRMHAKGSVALKALVKALYNYHLSAVQLSGES